MCRVTFCCCGCSLETGTAMYLGWSLGGGVWGILETLGILGNSDSEPVDIIVNIFALITSIPGIITLYKKSPPLLIPFLIYHWINIGSMVYEIIKLVKLTDQEKLNYAKKNFSIFMELAKKDGTEKESLQLAKLLVTAQEINYALTIVLVIYFFIVVLSYYLEMKEKDESQSPDGVQLPMNQPEPYAYPQQREVV